MERTGRLAVLPLVILGAISIGGLTPASASKTEPQYGPVGHHFRMSFSSSPSVTTAHFGASQFQTQYGAGVATMIRYRRGETFVDVNELSNNILTRHIGPYLRSFLPSPRGGRSTTWHDLPAATEFIACSNPSGPCAGNIGSLIVLDGTTIYDIFTTQRTTVLAQSVVYTFRLAR